MHPLLNIAIKAAKKAGDLIIRYLDRPNLIQVNEKSPNNFVTNVDQLAEQEIIQMISEFYPEHRILAEETGENNQHSDYTWIIDPIDGTNNFIHEHPHFSVSIGIKYKDRLEHGVIYDPLRQELFSATLGNGAFLNNHRLRVNHRTTTSLVIGMALGKITSQNIGPMLKAISLLLPEVTALRQSGSAALDCAYVACNRLDGLWGCGVSAWDIAAGILIIREAGGIVSDFDGNDKCLELGNLITGNPYLVNSLLELTKEL